ncbi:MAG: amino acid permease [Bacteroidales bacterium]|nr:amino acid permease [Bacteroidales bacterium]
MKIPGPQASSSFQKRLGLFDSTAIVAGSMIGSGIFIVSSDIARTVGAPGWLLVTWLATAVLTVFAAMTYGELASLFPHTGGQYVYLRKAYNPLVGFLYGWASLLVIQTGTIAAVAMAFAKFTGVLFPWIAEKNIGFEWGFLKISTVHLVAISSILMLTWINTLGISTGKFIQNIFTSTKVFVLLGMIVAGIFITSNLEAVKVNKEVFWDAAKAGPNGSVSLAGFALVAGIVTAMVGSLFSSDAWNNITFASDEVIRPQRNIPLSLIFGTLIVSVLYLLVNMAYMQSLPLRGTADGLTVAEKGMQYATDDRIGTAAMHGLLGENAALVMAVLIMISTFGCNNGLILSGARIYFAMAVDGLFFKKAGVLNARGVPGRALVFQGVYASLLCLSGTYSNLLDYVIFTVLLFYILSIVSVFIFRKKMPEEHRAFKAVGYPVIPVIYVIAVIFIMVILSVYKPLYTWPGLIIVALGVPVFFIWQRKRSA